VDCNFKDTVNPNSSRTLLRTDFFPGLGWMLLKSVWYEIRQKWPTNHWDWFMRNPATSKHRDTVYPEVPRDFHTGVKGTFMDEKTHRQYFDRIKYNTDPQFKWSPECYKDIMIDSYEKKFAQELNESIHVTAGWQLKIKTTRPKVVWYNANPSPMHEKYIRPLMEEFGLWHQLMRGAREGVHEFWYHGSKVILINTFKPKEQVKHKNKSAWFFGYKSITKWISFKPLGIPVFSGNRLLAQMRETPPEDWNPNTNEKRITLIAASESQVGRSCDEVCLQEHLKCNRDALSGINDCSLLEMWFSCKKCTESNGPDQPAYIVADSLCLVNTKPESFSCEGAFYQARRLCPCV